MRAVAVIEPGRVEIVEIPKPTPGSYEAVVKTEVSFLCNATDRKLIEGHFPGVEQYPLLLGHESVGIVEAVGNKVTSFHPGDRVISGLLLNPPDPAYASGWGGLSEYLVVRDHQAMVNDGVADAEHGWDELFQIQRVVPSDISPEAAALLCTWREVYAGFSDFRLKAGDDILVFGAGPVGLSFVKFAKLRGLGYVGSVDPLPEKRQKALEMGADDVFAPDDPALQKLPQTRQKPFDAIIDAVGREVIINAALPLVKMAGVICVYGVLDTATITVQKHLGPYNFNLLVHQWPTREWEAAAQEPVCEWLRQGKLQEQDFISAEYPIDRIQDAIDTANAGLAIKTMLRF
ncbi:zinc-binding dehydrogenase [candidate division KSB3 bacterium]|uniref:Zinc-binding dehydrogenase n=1 Tax=candidate division KSB3 bacterium TaxID=2044937 RepID=A0A9D5Q3U4_9BACT|nr:zinc-binding dehydrogenase [candidate division KSB3 bacterium]MBD3323009.1 zinc-binding dehydrogenase [candidate division KSB3 bacterium]